MINGHNPVADVVENGKEVVLSKTGDPAWENSEVCATDRRSG
jgi:hypothetical protein